MRPIKLRTLLRVVIWHFAIALLLLTPFVRNCDFRFFLECSCNCSNAIWESIKKPITQSLCADPYQSTYHFVALLACFTLWNRTVAQWHRGVCHIWLPRRKGKGSFHKMLLPHVLCVMIFTGTKHSGHRHTHRRVRWGSILYWSKCINREPKKHALLRRFLFLQWRPLPSRILCRTQRTFYCCHIGRKVPRRSKFLQNILFFIDIVCTTADTEKQVKEMMRHRLHIYEHTPIYSAEPRTL